MTTDIKPPKGVVVKLQTQLVEIEKTIGTMINYHNKRASFFEKWDSTFSTINAVVSVGALFFIGWQLADKTDSFFSTKTSLWIAFITVLLLFFSKKFDFSKKQEKHRLLVIIYMGYDKEITDMSLIIWNNLSAENYRIWKGLYDRLKEGINNLKREGLPMLEFELYLCEIRAKLTKETERLLFSKVNGWQFFWARYFSMENDKARFIVTHKYPERQKARQKQPEK